MDKDSIDVEEWEACEMAMTLMNKKGVDPSLLLQLVVVLVDVSSCQKAASSVGEQSNQCQWAATSSCGCGCGTVLLMVGHCDDVVVVP